ncbi:hypothetical protein BOO69_08215 [Sulfitobacter alexandrii]|uniref:Uncharacterized protein n=1 Tax=Sulfitobacter alexandrii TaxID=1917485 RepID=A0A1J0WGG1_9RHOB|nr:hypothetical protein [Sulfitobacter alexandrii]APE43401.1 hypothetical protein BOO69_08215 [Sulfitobacter alexandrii]
MAGQQASTKTTATVAPQEGNRARVRRLFIEPLTRDGMRFRHGTPPDEQRRRLDQMADDLGYLSDASLTVLAGCMVSKGEGANKVFWPSRVSILGYAEAREPRPLEEVPGLRSWFVSAAGRKAAGIPGRLVAEFGFWKRHKRPPLGDREWDAVNRNAGDYARRVELTRDRQARGVQVDPNDENWLARYDATDAMLRGWLADVDGDA